MNNSKRILINSSFLYVKTALTVVISIFLSRFLLEGLGIRDYGIYNVVGGVIGLIGFITATLINSNTRFIANALGKNDLNNSVIVFSTVKAITKKVVFFIFFSLLIIGLIFLNFILKIPYDRVFAAHIVYACMLVNTVYSLLTAPYSALLYSKERIKFLTTLDIIDTFLKLGIAYLLTQTTTIIDNLILYAVLLMLLSFAHRTVLKYYCLSTDVIAKRSKNLKATMDKSIARNILSFSGWNLLESIGIIVRKQGSVFLINIFFGVLVNAAYGIAIVVNTQMLQFSSSMLNAIKPVVYKNFGNENKERQNFLTFFTSKIGIILLSFIVVPVICEIDFILGIWLVEIPQHTATFIKLALVLTFISQMSYGLIISMQAYGKVKEIQIVTFVLQILNLPISFILFKTGFSVYSLYFVSISIEVLILVCRLYITNKYLQINIGSYLNNLIVKPSLFILFTYLIFNYIGDNSEPSLFRLLTIIMANIIITGVYFYFMILNNNEKQIIKNLIRTSIKKV